MRNSWPLSKNSLRLWKRPPVTDLRCEYCDTPAHSQSELFACEIKCEREDNMTRRWTKRYDFHRKD